MAMFGPTRQIAWNELGIGQGGRGGMFGQGQLASSMRGLNTMMTAMMEARRGISRSSAQSTVMSPGQTQVIRPSAQAPQRRAAAPQAGASSSLITSTPSPAEVALATTTLLGG